MLAQQAVSFSLRGLDGNDYSLPANGSLLVFFETDCPTCRLTFPYLNRLAQALGKTNILGISQDNEAVTREFVTQMQVSFPVALDHDLSVSQHYNPTAVPTLFLLDEQGNVLRTQIAFDKTELNDIAVLMCEAAGVAPFVLAESFDGNPATKPGCTSRHLEPQTEGDSAAAINLYSTRGHRASHIEIAEGLHSLATDQGSDYRDNNTELEPLVEIYQGYRNSYEYEGAPKAATTLNQQAQKSGWQPEGFWWNALAKGYKLGVQASSDHWSTHISYACLITESFTREGLLDAIRKRHSYAATDNIILDVRAKAGAVSYMMGDSFNSETAPQISVHAIGTMAIKQVDIVKNQTFVYTSHPGTKETRFDFADQDYAAGQNYYYVRVMQDDGQLAWSSPIWVKK